MLESEIRKLEQEKVKTKRELSQVIPVKSKTLDVNANSTNIISSTSTSSSDSSSLFISSMVSHWEPNLNRSIKPPSDITSMIAHCAVSPLPGSYLLSMSEVLEALEKAVEKMFATMNWVNSSTN